VSEIRLVGGQVEGHVRALRTSRAFVLLLAATLALAACGGASATFSTEGACVVDGRAVGAYPDLEAVAPRSLDGKAPTSLDSGRNCSDAALGTLISHGVHELHFGGSTWDEGQGAGTTIAMLALPGGTLPLTWAEEFYLAGAINAGKTDNVKSSHPTIPGVAEAFRVDALNDLSQQAVVLWQLGDDVRVVLVSTHVDPNASMANHEARVQAAIDAARAADPDTLYPDTSPSGSIPVPSPT
jgi:hypothetical protein